MKSVYWQIILRLGKHYQDKLNLPFPMIPLKMLRHLYLGEMRQQYYKINANKEIK